MGGHPGGYAQGTGGDYHSPASLSRVYPPPKGGGMGLGPWVWECGTVDCPGSPSLGFPVVQGRQVPATQGGLHGTPLLWGGSTVARVSFTSKFTNILGLIGW